MAHDKKFDVFISYSRKDSTEVNALVELLQQRIPGISIWFDVDGIESGDEFEEKIISAIDNSFCVLFALSDHSIASSWTKDEVIYAKNINTKVIPILLKGAEMKGWFLFKFGRVDYIDSTSQQHLDKLLKNLSAWTDKPLAVEQVEEAPQKAVENPTESATPKKAATPKKVATPKKAATPKKTTKKAEPNLEEELLEEFLASANLSFNSKDMTAEITKYRTDASAVVIPETVMHNHKSYRITSIGKNAFYALFGCNDYLKSLQLPDSITTIGKGAFQFLYQLTSITIPDGVTTIENMLFESCKSLTEINLPKKLTSIGNMAFYECKSLQSLVIPEGVTRIGDNAFSFCESITSLVIPEGVEEIGFAAFKGCSSLTSISLPASLKDLGSLDPFKNCDALKEIIIPKGTRKQFVQMYAIRDNNHQLKLVEK